MILIGLICNFALSVCAYAEASTGNPVTISQGPAPLGSVPEETASYIEIPGTGVQVQNKGDFAEINSVLASRSLGIVFQANVIDVQAGQPEEINMNSPPPAAPAGENHDYLGNEKISKNGRTAVFIPELITLAGGRTGKFYSVSLNFFENHKIVWVSAQFESREKLELAKSILLTARLAAKK